MSGHNQRPGLVDRLFDANVRLLRMLQRGDRRLMAFSMVGFVLLVAAMFVGGVRLPWFAAAPEPWQGERLVAMTPIDADDFVVRDGRRVARDEVSEQVLSAACQTLADWKRDRALRLDLLILSDQGLLRSAELLGGEFWGSRPALLAENLSTAGRSWASIERRVAEEFGDVGVETARRYLELRGEPPSPRAAEDYVVYATPSKLDEVLIVRLSVRPRPAVGVFGQPDIGVIAADGERLSIDTEWCR